MMKAISIVAVIAAMLSGMPPGFGQAQVAGVEKQPESLSRLIEEAQQKNPEVQAALHGQLSARHAQRGAGALPDTQIVVQQFNVGSPRPFAGYTNNDFAFIGLGVAQQIPWPGKRGLRSEIAGREAKSAQARMEAVQRSIVVQLKETYFRLAYLQQTLIILGENDKLLREVDQVAESRYTVGQGSQQDVLKAQLQHTAILQEINLRQREIEQAEAELKRLLARAQDSPDIVAEPLRERPLSKTAAELAAQVQSNPDVQAQQEMLNKSAKQVELARKEFRPDFGLQYMYQNTDRKFRDYYMMTLSLNLPNRGRRKAELATALEQQRSASAQLQAEVQQRQAAIQDAVVVAQSSAEQLRIYREGLIPQADATFRAALAGYETNKQDFETLLSSFLDVLKFQEAYQKELSDHESALARLESLTGVVLP
ncbi:MAG TPA: TolC family protein [Candidatus Limnocylindrales bacterium]|nr:TolC family protein [Candidatus Limnocylindrales bacterium]